MAIAQNWLLLLFLAVFAAPPAAAQTTITFDEFPARTELRHQYADKGVHFRGPTIFTANTPHSGKNVLYSVSPTQEVFSFPGSLVIDFDAAQRSVRLFAGIDAQVATTATLTAFNAAGTVIARDGPRSLPGQVKTLMEVKVAQPAIRRVELLFANDGNETMDDLTFEGLTGGGNPEPPPKVIIASPKPAQLTSPGTITVEGTVVGRALDPNAIIKVHIPRPPGSTTTADFTVPIQLADTGPPDRRSFSQAVSIDIGLQTITVDVQNTSGKHGLASVVVDSLPDDIRARLRQEGGTAALGAFSFGSVTASKKCSYAVYALGAIASTDGTTSTVRGAIFQKWLAKKNQGKFPELDCSLGAERVVEATARAQDFVGGRIYSSPGGTFFVPPVFAAAIDALGGEAGVGLPIADPTSDSHPAFLTWLFQRFARKGVPLASTLEIRGDPPQLVVQRQAGDGTLFADILRPNNPTIVETFKCQTSAGPCPVIASPDEPPITNTRAFCNGKAFNWLDLVSSAGGFHPDPPEWAPIKGHYVQTPIWGALFEVELARGDNPFAHRNFFDPCPTPTHVALANQTICPSDWDLKIRPLPGFRSMLAEQKSNVQIEFERVDFQAQLVKYGDPTVGDLIFASGRFVVDCGHNQEKDDRLPPRFKTEIHPPSVYVAVKSVTRNGRPSTQADIWVNRFFAGGDGPNDAVEFDIYPPPRPMPQATLGASTPGNQTGAVTVTFRSMGPYGPFRVRVTAKPGKPEITKYGEMKPRTDNEAFGFDGRLQVFWNCPGGACSPRPELKRTKTLGRPVKPAR